MMICQMKLSPPVPYIICPFAFTKTNQKIWLINYNKIGYVKICTLWCQLEDTFQIIVTPQGIEKVTIQLIDTTKVYAIGARLFLSKVPL